MYYLGGEVSFFDRYGAWLKDNLIHTVEIQSIVFTGVGL